MYARLITILCLCSAQPVVLSQILVQIHRLFSVLLGGYKISLSHFSLKWTSIHLSFSGITPKSSLWSLDPKRKKASMGKHWFGYQIPYDDGCTFYISSKAFYPHYKCIISPQFSSLGTYCWSQIGLMVKEAQSLQPELTGPWYLLSACSLLFYCKADLLKLPSPFVPHSLVLQSRQLHDKEQVGQPCKAQTLNK